MHAINDRIDIDNFYTVSHVAAVTRGTRSLRERSYTTSSIFLTCEFSAVASDSSYQMINAEAYIVLDAVASPPERVVLQIQYLKACVKILDKLADL